jgi:hypothetical protein
VSGSGQTDEVGTRLPQSVVFRVLDQHNNPLAGFTFVVRSLACTLENGLACIANHGDDQLANPTLTTGPDGTVTFTGWTLGPTPGPKCLGFYPGTTPPRSDGDIGTLAVCANAVGGAVTRLVVLSANSIPGNGGIIDVDVQARDQARNPVNGVVVTFEPSAGG